MTLIKFSERRTWPGVCTEDISLQFEKMEGKWKSDLASLLRAHTPTVCNITCRGVDTSFGVYQHALASHFSQTPLVWKRNGKVFQSRLSFPLKFIPFDEDLCWATNVSPSEFARMAYVHVFFINAASVDEYRTSVRHNVSEWFAKVSSKNDVQWMIVIDSTRAKEKKNRTALMEKLKNDFSKHQTRLVEVSESVEHGSFSELVKSVQSSLLAHLDVLTNAWDEHLGSTRDMYVDDNWNISQYFTSVTDYARVYWSLGALEHALTIFDDLDRFLTQIFLEMVEMNEKAPKWLLVLKDAEVPICPTIGQSMLQPSIDPRRDANFLGFRHFLVSQQILLCLYMYQARLRSRGAAPSLRVDFSGLIVKYAQHAQQTVAEQTEMLQIRCSRECLSCWTVFVVGEAVHVAGLLADPTSLEGSIPPVCTLFTRRFEATLQLGCVFDSARSDLKASLVKWLKNSGLTEDSILLEILQDPTVYATQLQKVHDSTSAFLTQCGRLRLAAHLGSQFCAWLRSHDRAEAALPYQLRAVTRFLADGCRSAVAVEMVKEVIEQLNKPDDYQRLLSFRLFVALFDSDEKTRENFTEKWILSLAEKPSSKLSFSLLSLVPNLPNPFSVKIIEFSSNVQLPNGKLSIDLVLVSRLALAVPNCRVVVRLRELDEGVMSRRKQPVFEMNYSSRDAACRILAPHRGHAFDRPVPASPHSHVIEIESNGQQLVPGENVLSLLAPMDTRGCYVLDSVQLLICDDAMSIDFDDVSIVRPVVVFVQCTPNKLCVKNAEAEFLAGVVQYLEVSLEAGCGLAATELRVKPADEDTLVEFRGENDVWSDSNSVQVPELEMGQQYSVRIPTCVLMNDQMTSKLTSQPIKLLFEWAGRSWTVELSFVSLLQMSWKTSLLENKLLFELDISHHLAPEYTVVVDGATLEVPRSDGSPAALAKLLNEQMEDLVPNIVSSLVWILPVSGDMPMKHQLALKYHVKSSGDHQQDSVILDSRQYSYGAEMELKVPKVDYELCTQMLSHQPGAQLCRLGSPCDLVVSLRSLNHGVEMLYIVLDADQKLWVLNENAKVLQVKESGLGQMAFSVVPCASGFLPYPSVSVFSCVTVGARNSSIGDGTWSEGVELVPGSPLLSFQRTAGKQIRVLAASQVDNRRNDDRKAGLKQKLVKLFD